MGREITLKDKGPGHRMTPPLTEQKSSVNEDQEVDLKYPISDLADERSHKFF